MRHSDLAQIAAVLAAVGAPCLLAARARWHVLAGLGLLVLAEAGFAVGLVPRHDVHVAFSSPAHIGAVVVAVLAGAALVGVVVRYPSLAAPFLMAAAPFRIPVTVSHDHDALLLLPLYGVIVVVTLAQFIRLFRGDDVKRLPNLLVVPVSAFVALDAVSLLWSQDIQQGAIELAFFIVPFAVLVAVVARAPLAGWVPKVLAWIIAAEACLFAVVGLWQVHSHHLFLNHPLVVANGYTTYFRVNSLFYDPNIYGRFLMLALGVLVLLLWRRRLHVAAAAALFALLASGLYVSYSLSSEIVLFATIIAVSVLVFTGVRTKVLVVIAAALIVVGLLGTAATVASGHSLRRVTSDRSRLVSITWTVFKNHPLAGVGVGAQPKVSNEERAVGSKKLDASHTTPLTVAAELGIVGVAAYLAFLACAGLLFLAAGRFDGTFAASLAIVFGAIAAHSFAYADFFEDPLAWGALGLAAAVVCRGRLTPNSS